MQQILNIKTGRIKWQLAFEDILYCKAECNYTTFFMKDGTRILTSKTLKLIETKIDSHPFFRIHSGYLVNLSNIVGLTNTPTLSVELKNGTLLPLSVRKKSAFIHIIKQQVLYVA